MDPDAWLKDMGVARQLVTDLHNEVTRITVENAKLREVRERPQSKPECVMGYADCNERGYCNGEC